MIIPLKKKFFIKSVPSFFKNEIMFLNIFSDWCLTVRYLFFVIFVKVIVIIEFSPLVFINVSNGHYHTLETTTNKTSLQWHLISEIATTWWLIVSNILILQLNESSKSDYFSSLMGSVEKEVNDGSMMSYCHYIPCCVLSKLTVIQLNLQCTLIVIVS